ncbi:MAG TPA: DUF4105 domain-containing protein [Myxococcaceae bacterium]|nr:DUF4105 domain-containing protein [Myxococcaceae bacterium]
MLHAFLLTALLSAAPADGTLPANGAPTSDADAARAFLAEHGVTLTTAPGATLEAALYVDLAEGLSRLPPAMRRPPGGPLEVQLHPSVRPYGMGAPDAPGDAPVWSGGRTRFHLYGVAPADDSPARHTQVLSPRAHARLWRQRALVHAVMQRWEDAEAFSAQHLWRRIMGWRRPLEQGLHLREIPRNVYEGAWLRPLGKVDAAFDLITFAEVRFVPVEALAPGRLHPAATLGCEEPTRIRALDALLFERGLLERPPPPPSCAPFEAWARPEALEHLEVLLVAPSGRQAESLFGHLLLRPVHRDRDVRTGPGLAPVIQLAALAEPRRAGLRRVWRGLTGGYLMTAFTLTHADLVEEALHDQQRTIRRYRLNLQPDASRRVLERAWEAERRGYFRYTFLSGNCAFLLAFLLEPALPPTTGVRFRGLWLISPGSTLDALADVRLLTDDGPQSLLSYVPGDLEATGEQAERAEAKRRDIEPALFAPLPEVAQAAWSRALQDVRAPTAEQRGQGYASLARLSRELPPSADAALHAWWAHAVRVERDRVERARHVLLELARSTVKDPDAQGAAMGDRVAVRQALFEDPEALAQQALLIDRTEVERLHLASLPHRPDTEGEAARRREAEATLALFTQVTALQADLNVQRLHAHSGARLLAEDAAAAQAEDAEWAARAQARSGAWRRGLGFGLRGGATPFLRLETAALGERLGDQRLHGLHPSSEVSILDGHMDLTWSGQGWPRILSSDLTLLGLRTLARKAPHLRHGVLDHLGFGVALELGRQPDRHLPQRLQASGEAWLPMGAETAWHRFSAVGLGVAVGGLWGPPLSGDAGVDDRREGATSAGGVGPRLLWRTRLGLSDRAPTALRITGVAQSTWLGLRAQDLPAWLHELEAEVEVELPLFLGGTMVGMLRPGATVRIDGVGEGRLRPVASVMLRFEPTH